MSGLETVNVEGYTPDFSISPKLFRLLDKFLNIIPGLYRFSHVVLALGKKAVRDS